MSYVNKMLIILRSIWVFKINFFKCIIFVLRTKIINEKSVKFKQIKHFLYQ